MKVLFFFHSLIFLVIYLILFFRFAFSSSEGCLLSYTFIINIKKKLRSSDAIILGKLLQVERLISNWLFFPLLVLLLLVAFICSP